MLGSVREVSLVQPPNAEFPILLNVWGRVREVSSVQFPNALFPIAVNVLGSVREVSSQTKDTHIHDVMSAYTFPRATYTHNT